MIKVQILDIDLDTGELHDDSVLTCFGGGKGSKPAPAPVPTADPLVLEQGLDEDEGTDLKKKKRKKVGKSSLTVARKSVVGTGTKVGKGGGSGLSVSKK